jgi:uncharacterized OB-fold protein
MALTQRHNSTAGLTHWRGNIPVDYVYTAGRAGERFFRGLMQGKLVAAECTTCRVTYLPPRTYCERCFGRLEDNYVEVSPRGQVHAYTVCHKKLDGTPSSTPILLGVIKINDTDGVLVHYLGEVKTEEVHIGMLVKGVLRPKKERKGSILDIKYFKPEV